MWQTELSCVIVIDAVFETATILMESASKIIKKLSPLKNELCEIQPVKDGFFGRSKNNENIDKYNEAIENVAFLTLT